MGKKEKININQLRSSYAVRVAKVQEEAFRELNKQLHEIIDEIVETIIKEIQKCENTNQSKN